MITNDTKVVSLVADQLRVGHAAVGSHLGVLPLERLVRNVISCQVVLAIFCSSILFGQTAAAVLERSEDGGRNHGIVHRLSTATEQSLGEKNTSLNGNRSKLKLTVEHITDSINVSNVGLLLIIDLELSILLDDESSLIAIDASSNGITTHGEENSVVLFLLLLTILHVSHDGLTIGIRLLKSAGSSTLDEFGVSILHVLTDLACDLLIEATEQD